MWARVCRVLPTAPLSTRSNFRTNRGDGTGDHDTTGGTPQQSTSQPVAGYRTRRVEGERLHRRLLLQDGHFAFHDREVGLMCSL